MMAAAHISVARSLTGGASSPQYDCAACDREPWRRIQLGHDGPPALAYGQRLWDDNLVSGKPLAECPRRTLLRAAEDAPVLLREMVRVRDVYLPEYRRGHLPTAGGTGDQPARLMAYMREAERIAALGEAAVTPEDGA